MLATKIQQTILETRHFEIFELIFQNVNDKNPIDIDGDTPLHGAAAKGHLGIVKSSKQWWRYTSR